MHPEYLKAIIEDVRKSRKTLYIFCGLPYSGKTYVGKEIVEKTSCVYVSIDAILEELGYSWDSNKLPDGNGWRDIFDISYLKSAESLNKGLNVLYDSTNHTKISRDKLREMAAETGASARVIYVEVPVATVWERWEANKNDKNRPTIAKDLIEMTINSFETPTKEEDVLVVKNA